jgi:hypothetical protein
MAEPADVPALVAMVHELAEYHRAPDECHLVEEQLHGALFGPRPTFFGHVAIDSGEPVGMALWFLNFSTWRGVHGIYLEDLYVRPAHAAREPVGPYWPSLRRPVPGAATTASTGRSCTGTRRASSTWRSARSPGTNGSPTASTAPPCVRWPIRRGREE